MPSSAVRLSGLAAFLLALPLAVSAAEDGEVAELEMAYGDDAMVSIATGRQQALSRAPAVATVITARAIAAMGATELDQVLESVPGLHVSVSSFGSNALYSMRGIFTAYNQHVLMMVNGVPLTNVFLGNRGIVWGGMPLENVARIEVIRGPGSALYGADAFAGVINVITKAAADINGTEAGLRVGSFESRDAWLQHGSRHEELDVALYLRKGRSQGHRETIEADAQTLFDSTFFAASPAASLAPAPANTFRDALDARLDLGWREWRLRSAWQERSVGNGAGLAESLDPWSRVPATRFYADLGYENAGWAPQWEVSGLLGYFDVREKPAEPAYMLFPAGAFGGSFTDPATGDPVPVLGNPGHAERHTHASLAAFYTGFARHRVRLGVGYRLEDLYRTTETKNFRLDPGPGFVPRSGGMEDVTGTPDIFLQPQRREVTYGFVQDEWTLAKDWALTLGLRHDQYSDFGGTSNPRLALVWDAAYSLVVKALHGRAFRAPSFTEQYSRNNPVTLGNPQLDPETIATSELAFAWQPPGALQADLSLFRYDMEDIILFLPNAVASTGSTAQNAGNQTGYGLELEGRWDPRRELRATGSVSLQRSTDERSGQDAGLAPRQRYFVRVEWRFRPQWQLGSTLNHVADRERQPGDSRAAIDDYTTLDLMLRRENLFGQGEVRAAALNVFDVDAREPALAPGYIAHDLPLAGRAFYVQLQYRL